MWPTLIRKYKKLFKLSLFIVGFMLAKSFCEDKTKGFTFTAIDQNIPYDASLTTHSNFDPKVLAQPFRFLDRGGQSYVFVSEDKTLVIKFFKKQYHIPDALIHALDSSLPGFLKERRFEFLKTRNERFYPIFESCKIAREHLQEETGVCYLHFNPTKDLSPLEVIDNLGIHYLVDLNTTSFIVQKYAERIFTKMEEQLANNDVEGAKKLIHSVFEYIQKRSAQGIRDNDNGLRRNYGCQDNKAVSLDVGSFVLDDSLKEPLTAQMELERKTKQLGQWLADNHPELVPYFNEQGAVYGNSN